MHQRTDQWREQKTSNSVYKVQMPKLQCNVEIVLLYQSVNWKLLNIPALSPPTSSSSPYPSHISHLTAMNSVDIFSNYKFIIM
jgi:hypothetical protein